MCNASLTQYYLEMKFVDFGLVALLSNYGVICSPLAVASNPESSEEQIPHNRLLINMTVQSVLYNKSDSGQSEIQRTLSFAYLSIPRTVCTIEGAA